ncbi:MAG: HAMP domain-containing sensor histidine kinase [Eubacteriales bacterium]
MRKNKSKAQISISNQLIKSYLMMYPLFILSYFAVLLVGTLISSGWLQGSNIELQYTAEELIRTDIEEIDISGVVSSDGGAAVVFENGIVKELGGHSLFKKTTLTKSEWTDFLTSVKSPDGEYVYSVTYNDEENFWLVVGFPVSIRVRLSIATNSQSSEYTKALILYMGMILALIFLVFLGAWLYAKYSAKTFISPLRKLCSMVKRITHGEYEIEESEDLNGEFLWLKNDINKLSAELKREKILREKAENDKKQNLMDISHDLRNPIAAIMGYAEILSTSNKLDNEKYTQYADVILRNSIRANDLMNDLFTYTKLDHTGFKPTLRKLDICEFMREEASKFLSEFEMAGIYTEFDIEESEIMIPIDEKLMHRAFANLFTNCIQHNKVGTKFTLSLTEEKDTVKIVLADDGSGIEESIAKTIFEPFVRSDKSRNSKTGGSGLGLAITSKIIKAHNGSIELETEQGKGSRFIVRLKKYI